MKFPNQNSSLISTTSRKSIILSLCEMKRKKRKKVKKKLKKKKKKNEIVMEMKFETKERGKTNKN